jgi:hypothetical protein
MAILAEHMTRLCGEIQTMRRTRTVLKDELENKMRERRTAVSQMQANFANAHAETAKRAKSDRLGFVSGLKQTVAGQRRGTNNDLAGAHRAWFGKGTKRTAR